MKFINWKNIFFFLSVVFLAVRSVSANGLPDADRDGVPDRDETEVYYTNPNAADTDGDGYSDFSEINRGFSPHNPQPVKLTESDLDRDGLSDAWEIKFKTDPANPDTDGDGFKDGAEADQGFDPARPDGARLNVSLHINLKTQKLDYLLNGYVWKSFAVSTGKAGTPTPKGEFKIVNKVNKAWSREHGLWMPYWLGLNTNGVGIHELPIWPNGYREGENHLGRPVSHGCIRLGIGPAAYIYERMATGIKVVIN